MPVVLLLLAALAAAAQPWQPITGTERVENFVQGTYGPNSLFVGGVFSSSFRTLNNNPREWGPGWSGFGRRYGMRLVNNSVNNGVEVALGALWDEDPRYHPLHKGSPGKRIGYALKRTFYNRYGTSREHFGAARFAGIVAGSFGQNLWMPDSVNDARHGVRRIAGNYAGSAVGNLFREFTPEIKKIFKRK
jgi:hypothetical protein